VRTCEGERERERESVQVSRSRVAFRRKKSVDIFTDAA
jgi:hypothetical protein